MTDSDSASVSPAAPARALVVFGKTPGCWLALLGLTAGLTFVINLYLLTFKPASLQAFQEVMNGDRLMEHGEVPSGLLTLALSLAILATAAYSLRHRGARGAVIFGAITALVLAANLALMAWAPIILDGYMEMAAVSFWQLNGFALGLLTSVLLAIAVAAVWIRPRVFRAWVIFSLTLAGILVGMLVLVALSPALMRAFERFPPLLLPDVQLRVADALVTSALLLLVIPALVLWGLGYLWKRSGWWIAGGYLGLAPVLVYLAVDDPVVRRPMTMEEIAPAFPGAEKSHELVLRYGKNHPEGRNFNLGRHVWEKPFGANQSFSPNDPEKWINMLHAHQADLELDWKELAPAWAWWNELNAFDRLGDLTPTRYDAEIIAFAPIRTVSQHACAIASLQALDGHGDEAIATVLPVLQVGRKLQPSARTLVRFMVAIVVEKLSLSTIGFILDHATISAATREQLRAVLAGGGGGVAGARRLMAIEYAFESGAFAGKSLGDLLGETALAPWFWHRAINLLSPFLYNQRATFNIYGDYVVEAQEIVGNRQLDRLPLLLQRFVEKDARPTFKNLMGKELLQMAVPAYSQVVGSYWDTQDQRAAMLSRVEKLATR